MNTLSKLIIGNSSNGKQIAITSTTSASAILLHTAPTSTAVYDEIYLYAYNDTYAATSCSILWGGKTEPNDVVRAMIPPRQGRCLIVDGKLISSNSIYAYASTGSGVVIDGFVNRYISDSYVNPHVIAWCNRVVSNGGSNPSLNTQLALSNFIQTLYNTNLYYKMIAVNCFVPDNLIATMTPLIRGGGYDPWINHGFIMSDLTIDGLAGDGSSKYIDTGIIPGTAYNNNNFNVGLSLYVSNIPISEYKMDFGVISGSGNFSIYAANATGLGYFFCWNAINYGVDLLQFNYPSNTFAGFVCGTRQTNSSLTAYYANGTTPFGQCGIGSGTQTGININNYSIYEFNMNSNGSPTTGNFSSKRHSFSAIHYGLSQLDATNLYNAVQKMRIDIGGGYI